jgi:hypothetical protein
MYEVLKSNGNKLATRSGALEKRFSDGRRKRQATLRVPHPRPRCVGQSWKVPLAPPMGMPARPTPEATTIGLCLQYGRIWKIGHSKDRQKCSHYSSKLITFMTTLLLLPWCILMNRFSGVLTKIVGHCRSGSWYRTRESRDARLLMAHTFVASLVPFTFSKLCTLLGYIGTAVYTHIFVVLLYFWVRRNKL